MLFLRWATDNPTELIPLENTWADSGLPITAGYFLFLDKLPEDKAAFEVNIRKQLPVPTTSAFAWAITDAVEPLQTLVKTKLNSNKPCVDGNTQLSLPPGLADVGFIDGAPVLSISAGGFITGFVVTHPALTAPQPNPQGLMLAMTGPYVGCVQFGGLIDTFGETPVGETAIKNLVNVSIDPHNPLDTQRNYLRFTGAEYLLIQSGDAYSIARVP